MGLVHGVRAQQHDAFEYAPRTYVCQRTVSQLAIDGVLAEEAWQLARWTEDFIDIEGDIQPVPYYQTRVKMLWDDQYLYIAAELQEEHLWATYKERDMVIFHENDFEVFIDPDGDTHNYYELEINALGTIWDLLLTKPYRDGGRAIDAWDIRGLKKAVALDGTLNDPTDKDVEWTVELAIPWTVLQEAAPKKIPEDRDIWRINFSRVQWHLMAETNEYTKEIDPETGRHYPEYNWVWSPQGVIAMHQPETWGFLQFVESTVGEESPAFIPDPWDETKWTLRQVYYAQQAYREEHGSYATSLSTLRLDGEKYDNVRLFTTPNNYEVILEGWSIRSDGQLLPSKSE